MQRNLNIYTACFRYMYSVVSLLVLEHLSSFEQFLSLSSYWTYSALFPGLSLSLRLSPPTLFNCSRKICSELFFLCIHHFSLVTHYSNPRTQPSFLHLPDSHLSSLHPSHEINFCIPLFISVFYLSVAVWMFRFPDFVLSLSLSPCADMLLRSISADSWKKSRGS